ncbi:hypothetical protein AYY17_10395 [Morganella psychrotolerans]|uniref:Uncharacterized protein n=1 Tax=Morganella psychrotolerans TaxID=368603 RepID=A0A1B8H2U5_9GAMM|nr:hypothetical protein AYY17_10395 [Morganella psychrotolerans]
MQAFFLAENKAADSAQSAVNEFFFVIYVKNNLKTRYKQEINSSGKCKYISHYQKNKIKNVRDTSQCNVTRHHSCHRYVVRRNVPENLLPGDKCGLHILHMNA